MFIRLFRPTNNTLRFKKSMFLVKFKKILKKFKFFTKNSAGRNNIGGITVFSKGIRKKSNTIISTINMWDKYRTNIISIFRNKKKLYSLQKHSTGSLSITPYIQGVCINQKVFSTNLPQKYWGSDLPGNYILLKFLGKFSIFSNIFIKNCNKYARSNGTFCQLLDYFYDFNLCKVVLPSKNCIYISGYSFVLLGSNSLQQNKFCVLGKAGVCYIKGKKSKVRGVARNPVDHPHGGRTKTNQPEVSIWGWVAKKNK